MTITAVILLIAFGLLLLLLEVLVLPGGIVGIIGLLAVIVSIYYGYQIDTQTGHIILGSTVLASAALVYGAIRSKTWDKLSLKSELTGKVGSFDAPLQIGDQGVAVSRLTPIGKARFGDQYIEVRSEGAYIEEGEEVEIIELESNRVTVK